MYQVDNAIIMAAGTSSRFAPLSYETHKGLIEVRGEVLVERQIRQLRSAGINDIVIVVGYKAEQFQYLEQKFGVTLILNEEYLTRNNNGSIYAARKYLGNSYICSVDNYFLENPFEKEVDDSYYAAVYAKGPTNEWCIREGKDGYINSVEIGGANSWYMMGHTFWNRKFSEKFLTILDEIYDEPETVNLLWESIYCKHLDQLKMKIRHYQNSIYEFDTLDELREFDPSYCENTRSKIIRNIANKLNVKEEDIVKLTTIKDTSNEACGFQFYTNGMKYLYKYSEGEVKGE